PALVSVTGAEGANDMLVINGRAGNDTISAATMPVGVMKLTIDGGDGNDAINGGAGADLLLGGDGNDIVDGNQGNDVAFLGAGDDVFVWNPGHGSGTVEGQRGLDTLGFSGSNAGESNDIAANGGRTRLFRDVANITMDVDDVESVDI